MTDRRASSAGALRQGATLAELPPKNPVEVPGTTRERLQGMSRIEADAREVLLRRRSSITQPPARAHDPEARWTDYESHPDPLPESVRGELADIDGALARIREGRFGLCLACGGPMGLQRLRAIPEARYCIACSGHVAAV